MDGLTSLWKRLRRGIALFLIFAGAIHAAAQSIRGNIATESGNKLGDVQVTFESNCPRRASFALRSDSSGTYSRTLEDSLCKAFVVTPHKQDNAAQGLSTYDLVLILKHILGLESLNSPYKMIAADANKSNTITSSDIIELRKLILGIYNQLPLAPSWRFIPKDHVFPDPANPFVAPFPEDITIPSGVTNKEADFIGVKVGDVNWSASSGSFSDKPKTLNFGTPAFAAKGSVVTIPVTYTGREALCAMQMGLRFDPKKLRLISPSKGDIEGWNAGCFGLTRADQGEIRTLWLPINGNFEHAIAPGKVLFHLSFRVLEDLPENGLPIHLDDAVLNNAAWYSKGEEFSLQIGEAEALDRDRKEQTAPARIKAECVPNPFAEATVLSISSNYTGRGRLILFDAYGQLIERQELWLEKGEQLVPLEALVKQPNGVYCWSLLTPEERLTGHVIKQ